MVHPGAPLLLRAADDYCGDFCPSALLLGNDPGDRFGNSVAGVGTNAFVIGAPYAEWNNTFTNSGMVYLYNLDNLGNRLSITNPAPATNDNFGFAVASFDPGRFLVSAPYNTVSGIENAGSAYLYSAAGTLLRTINHPVPRKNDFFGHALARVGKDLILVGAYNYDVGTNTSAGTAYVLTTNGTRLVTVTNPAPRASDKFGWAVAALGDDRFVVSAPGPGAGDLLSVPGRVYLYSTNGTRLRTIKNPNPSTMRNVGIMFGNSVVALGNGRFVVSDPSYAILTPTSTNIWAGAVYLYDSEGQLLRTLRNPQPAPACFFGYSLARQGEDGFVVGQMNHYSGGSVLDTVYLCNGDADVLATLRKGEPNSQDVFGVSLATIGNDWVLAGAPESDLEGKGKGAVYLYDVRMPTYPLGSEIPRPTGLALADIPANGPEIDPPDAAFWHRRSALEGRLYATRVGRVLVRWTPEIAVQGLNIWPTNAADYQVHVANTPPVDLTDRGRFTSTELRSSDPETGANPDAVKQTHQFQATGAGKSLLLLAAGDPKNSPIFFQLVSSVAWNTVPHLRDNVPALIGTEIVPLVADHDTNCGGPFVYWPNSFYCPDPGYYSRSTRTGPIIPVNLDQPGDADDLVVVYYRMGTVLKDAAHWRNEPSSIGWPWKPVRYRCDWPLSGNTNTLGTNVIANYCDKEVINTAKFVDWDLYVQNDPARPGFNPNDEHALRMPWNGGEAIFPLRDDLGSSTTSLPFVLMKYRDAEDHLKPKIKLFKVVATNATYPLNYHALAGTLLQPPYPLSLLQTEAAGVSGPFWQDRKASFWAKAAANNGGPATLDMRYWYSRQPDFFCPGPNPPAVGAMLPWLDVRAGTAGTPIKVRFTVHWPDKTNEIPTAGLCGLASRALAELRVGETLVQAKSSNLPDIQSQSSAEVLYQQTQALDSRRHSVLLIDPTAPREVALTNLPPDIPTVNEGGVLLFPTLPPHLRTRFFYDPLNYRLKFRGQFVEPAGGEYYLLLNVITDRERDILRGLAARSVGPDRTRFIAAVNGLATDLVEVLPQQTQGIDSLALTAGAATGIGYVVMAFGNNTNLTPASEPVSLEVFRVDCPLYRGQLKTIMSDNAFDEKLTLRHSADFAGRAHQYRFEWLYASPAADGSKPDLPVTGADGRIDYKTWHPFTPTPADGRGALDITIEGPGLQTLIDQYFTCRYQPIEAGFVCGTNFSEWTDAKLAEGWIKRVLRAIDPFEQRIKQYRNNPVNTLVSMIGQAGPPWVGNVALNARAANSFGLIELYQTILNRGIGLSIEGAPPVVGNPEVDNALLLAAGRIADLYQLLGNEAYADAADPTIALGTSDGQYGAEATSIHCFMNQTASLLEEELALLRGRDASKQPGVQQYPIYNRLMWNFTRDITGGEVAYALNYNVRNEDGDVSGTIDEADAKVLYPQGHGDAWGHYLSAIKGYYRLLQHPNFNWLARSEAVEVGGLDVDVDYLDERKFAAAAAAKARTGAEIVNLTYRERYVEDPGRSWPGYSDPLFEPKSDNPGAESAARQPEPRAWGLSDWASRAGQGALLDWVVANALLPPLNTNATGIQRIDRTTVAELRTVPAAYQEIQAKLDLADRGLNPLGVAPNAIPFDLDPARVAQGHTHFEQIYDRAVMAMNSAIGVFNHANNSAQQLRRQADTVADFQVAVVEREADFNSRLVEIFGYPYADDIGPAGTYPAGYSGPDLYHYDYVDASELLGLSPPPVQTLTNYVREIGVDSDGDLIRTNRLVRFHVSRQGLGLIKPAGWTGKRRAPGEIQVARSDILQAKTRLERAIREYDNLINQIQDQAELLQAQEDLHASNIWILNDQIGQVGTLNDSIRAARERQWGFQNAAHVATLIANGTAESLPKVMGFAVDTTAPIRSSIMLLGEVAREAAAALAEREGLNELDAQLAREELALSTSVRLQELQQDHSIQQQIRQLEQLVRQEPNLRLEVPALYEVLQQAAGRYLAALARGDRLLEDRLRFRQQTAARIQEYRYRDMAFRIFRNDALQKYRAQFDLAALYVYLAAKAYDYETCLLEGDRRGPGKNFLAEIVRSRCLGLILAGQPQTGGAQGDPGLADPMARMFLNWSLVLNGQLGFNNPQTETGRFSLRYELFRLLPGATNDATWRAALRSHIVPNLLDLPEFRRYCIPFYPQLAVEPGIVIPFSTTINFGENLFGWPAGGGDNSYDSTHFATKIHSVGVWFANYNNLSGGMVNTPRVYLVPVGVDLMRSPTDYLGAVREWKVLDQTIPVPFPFGLGYLLDPHWIPVEDALFDELSAIRKYASFRAYHDSGLFDPAETIANTRLVGRSVWNTRWLLVIPAGTLNSDRNEGLQRFISGPLLNGQRTGNGVSDIKLFFRTYAYSGN
jgi:hypothetical protein